MGLPPTRAIPATIPADDRRALVAGGRPQNRSSASLELPGRCSWGSNPPEIPSLLTILTPLAHRFDSPHQQTYHGEYGGYDRSLPPRHLSGSVRMMNGLASDQRPAEMDRSCPVQRKPGDVGLDPISFPIAARAGRLPSATCESYRHPARGPGSQGRSRYLKAACSVARSDRNRSR